MTKTCPACQGCGRTKDAQSQLSCPWCFEKGEVSEEVWNVYWSVRRATPHEFHCVFGARVKLEYLKRPEELKLFPQKRF